MAHYPKCWDCFPLFFWSCFVSIVYVWTSLFNLWWYLIGKFIIAYVPACGEKEYYIGCSCEELYAPPSAYFALYGLTVQSSFLGGNFLLSHSSYVIFWELASKQDPKEICLRNILAYFLHAVQLQYIKCIGSWENLRNHRDQ